jgi:hypothetical protein
MDEKLEKKRMIIIRSIKTDRVLNVKTKKRNHKLFYLEFFD